MLPHGFPKWLLVYSYYAKWKEDGTFENIHEVLRNTCRRQQGREVSPVEIHAANDHDNKAGFRVIEALNCRFERMKKVYADGGYRGKLAEKVKSKFGWDVEITLHSDTATDFKPLPMRWVVERTFSWLENFRRLAKDYEYKITASTAMIQLTFIALILNIFFAIQFKRFLSIGSPLRLL
jgi:putative transposase